jgi:hypothetical protein
MTPLLEIRHVQSVMSPTAKLCRSYLDTQVHPAKSRLNTCLTCARMRLGHLRIVPTSANRWRGDFLPRLNRVPTGNRSGGPLAKERRREAKNDRLNWLWCGSSPREKTSVGNGNTVARDCKNAKRPTDGMIVSTARHLWNALGVSCARSLPPALSFNS